MLLDVQLLDKNVQVINRLSKNIANKAPGLTIGFLNGCLCNFGEMYPCKKRIILEYMQYWFSNIGL